MEGETPLRIARFETENADLGTGAKKNKPKYQAIAEEMKVEAPKLIMQSVLQDLRLHGFADVAELDEEEALPEEYLLVRGEFTVLNPGSRGKRYGVGFGAGKSEVCATGEVVDHNEQVLMEFDHCRQGAMGFAGGDSENQMSEDSWESGSHFAEFMNQWAAGKYADR